MLYSNRIAYHPTKDVLDKVLINVPRHTKALLYTIDNEATATQMVESGVSEVYCINDCELFKECKFQDTEEIHNFIGYDSITQVPLKEITLFIFDRSILGDSSKLTSVLVQLPKNAVIIYYQVSDDLPKEGLTLEAEQYLLEEEFSVETETIIENPTIAEYLRHKLMVHALDSKSMSIFAFVTQFCARDSPKVVCKTKYTIYKRKCRKI